MLEINSDEDFSISGIPPEIVDVSNILKLLPPKSKEKYEVAYKRFMDYRQDKKATYCSENVLIAYFMDLSKKVKASTLWATYSMLKSTLAMKDNVDISRYHKLRAFIKRQSEGYRATRSQTLTKKQVQQFLLEAPDNTFLMTKVALIFGIYGACRRDELTSMSLNDIQDLGSKLLISIPKDKTNKPRTFIVNETYLGIYRKYTAHRPPNFDISRFFFKFTNGRGYRQPVGVHQFGKMPQIVATFLKLPNPEEYTGHCFRLSSAKILGDAEIEYV